MNGIYGYKDLETGYVVYIGRDSHIDKNRRHKQHLDKSKKYSQPFNTFLQSNPDRCEYFIIKKGNFSNEELNILEEHYINFYGTYKNHKSIGLKYGWNFKPGGDNHELTESVKKQIQETISEINNKSGYRYVYRRDNSWVYATTKNNKKITIIERTIKELEKTVKSKKMTWDIIDYQKAKKSQEIDLKKPPIGHISTNTSGYLRVSQAKKSWIYKIIKNGKKIQIQEKTLSELEKSIKDQNLPWEITDKEKAKKSKEKDLSKFSGNVSSKNTSGFLRVSKEGNSWRYSVTKNGKRIRFQRKTLKELEVETKKRGLPWEIVDKEKARKSWAECE